MRRGVRACWNNVLFLLETGAINYSAARLPVRLASGGGTKHAQGYLESSLDKLNSAEPVQHGATSFFSELFESDISLCSITDLTPRLNRVLNSPAARCPHCFGCPQTSSLYWLLRRGSLFLHREIMFQFSGPGLKFLKD